MGHMSKVFLASGLRRSFLNVSQNYKVVRSASTKYQEESWEKEIYTTAPIDKVSDTLFWIPKVLQFNAIYHLHALNIYHCSYRCHKSDVSAANRLFDFAKDSHLSPVFVGFI